MSAEIPGGSKKSKKLARFLERCREERMPEEGFTIVDAATWLMLHSDEAEETEQNMRDEESPAA